MTPVYDLQDLRDTIEGSFHDEDQAEIDLSNGDINLEELKAVHDESERRRNDAWERIAEMCGEVTP